ncbi:hypothetical protein AB0D78_28105 [Streptomyces avermitilis]|uniref:hypothetical protein n=1 Tax=Streptomyces avermitilis TaxID=33903 RepID=UPI0033C1FD7E
MPTTDTFGQGFAALDYGDVPDLKTMGDGLLKIAGQSVMRFASASTRNATLTSPVAGMVAWLNSEKLFTGYDGTAWVVLAAGTQAWTDIPLVAGWSTADADNNANGTPQYRIVNLFGETTLQFRGAIGKTTYPGSVPSSWVITSTPLPTAARPTKKRTIVIPCSDANSDRITLKMDIQTDGHLSVWGTNSTAKPPWIGFNGCMCPL